MNGLGDTTQERPCLAAGQSVDAAPTASGGDVGPTEVGGDVGPTGVGGVAGPSAAGGDARPAAELLERYRALVETSSDLIWSLDREGRWSFVNSHAARTIYGYDAEEMLGLPLLDFAVPSDSEHDARALAQLREGRASVSYQSVHRRKDGSSVELALSATAVRDDEGALSAVYGTAVDITAQKETERELLAQKRFLRQVLDINPSLIFAKDRTGRFTLVNKATADMYGSTIDDLIGRTDADFNLNAEEVEHFRRDDIEVMDLLQEKFIAEEVLTDSRGELRVLQTVKRPIVDADGSSQQVLGVATDITERKRIESMLRTIALVISSNEGDDLFQEIVRQLTQLLGVSHAFIGEVIGEENDRVRTLAFAENGSFIPNMEYALPGSATEQVMRNELRFESDVTSRFPDDPDFAKLGVSSYYGVPLYSNERTPLGVLAVMNDRPFEAIERIDSTLQIFGARASSELERIRSERERRELERQLQHVQKLESLGVLAGGIAHDFNNLLMGVLGNACLVLNEIPPGSKAFHRVGQIQSIAEKASTLTNQLLAYSGKAAFSVERLHLPTLVRELGGLLETVISKNATLSYEIDDELPPIEADPAQIQQVVMNLLTNASDALGSESGDIRLKVCRLDPHELGVRRDNYGRLLPAATYVVLEVADTGCGMDEATRTKIFDPFFTTKFTGRGLGLAAVLGIVRMHNGTVEVETEPGAGTVFRILFPASDLEPSEPRVAEEPVPHEWQGSGAVLVVDDEPTVRAVAHQLLLELGFDVITAADGVEALELFSTHGATLRAALLDMTMPKLQGDKVLLEMLRRRPGFPVILASGYAEQEVRAKVIGSAAGFLQKPFGLNELRRAMRTALDE